MSSVRISDTWPPTIDPQVGRQGHAGGRAEGHAQGRAERAHKVLAARAFAVTADVRARIDGETEITRLKSGFEAAVTATALGDVFRDS
jgi:hypothetical protein